ncbi:MAG: response regulator [Bacteroidia bacterium]
MELAQLFQPLSKIVNSLFIVDDDKITVFMACKLIENYNSDIAISYSLNPAEALDLLLNNKIKPDLILLDINMPDINGWQFLQKLESENYLTDVIMFSSTIDEDEIKKSKQFKLVKGFVTKPLNFQKLKEIIG